MNQDINLTPSEWDIMRIIWRHQPCTLRMICDESAKAHEWTRHAVISFLKRMETKGAICVDDSQQYKLYSALIEQDETMRHELSGTISRVFDGNPMLMVSFLAKSKDYTEDEIQEMIDILRNGGESADD